MLLLHRQLSIFITTAVSCAQSSYGFLSRIFVLRSHCSGIRSYVLVYLSLFYYLVLIWASGTHYHGRLDLHKSSSLVGTSARGDPLGHTCCFDSAPSVTCNCDLVLHVWQDGRPIGGQAVHFGSTEPPVHFGFRG